MGVAGEKEEEEKLLPSLSSPLHAAAAGEACFARKKWSGGGFPTPKVRGRWEGGGKGKRSGMEEEEEEEEEALLGYVVYGSGGRRRRREVRRWFEVRWEERG